MTRTDGRLGSADHSNESRWGPEALAAATCNPLPRFPQGPRGERGPRGPTGKAGPKVRKILTFNVNSMRSFDNTHWNRSRLLSSFPAGQLGDRRTTGTSRREGRVDFRRSSRNPSHRFIHKCPCLGFRVCPDLRGQRDSPDPRAHL